jgi:hypothetical protein
MQFVKGQSGNPLGAGRTKPFRDALRMELAAAGEDHKALREIAQNLIAICRLPEIGALPAIREMADRMDGKVPQGHGGDEELPPVQMIITGVPRVGD